MSPKIVSQFDRVARISDIRKTLQSALALENWDSFKDNRTRIIENIAQGQSYSWQMRTGHYFLVSAETAGKIFTGSEVSSESISTKLLSGGSKSALERLRREEISAIYLTRKHAVVAVIIPEKIAYQQLELQEEKAVDVNAKHIEKIVKIAADSGRYIDISVDEKGNVRRIIISPKEPSFT